MATNAPVSSVGLQPAPDAAKIVDFVAKSAIVLATIIYGCGFLVISIDQYRYGLAGANLLRPKVLAAGIWFLCFVTIPIVLVNYGTGFKFKYSSPGRDQWLRMRSTTLFFSAVSSFWIGLILSRAFDIQIGAEPTGPSTGTISLVMLLSGALILADQYSHFPHWIAVLASLGFGGLLLFCGIRDLAVWHRTSVAGLAFWFIASDYLAALEMNSRNWKLTVGNWLQTVAVILTAVTSFAGLYYPHIKASWGGGSPVPATIYFTKDSVILPGRSVTAKILDETDSGFYVIGEDDKKATFVPRSEVAMIYYSDDANGPFLTKTK